MQSGGPLCVDRKVNTNLSIPLDYSANGTANPVKGGAEMIMGPPPAIVFMQQLRNMITVPKALRAAILLGVPEILSSSPKPMSAQAIVSKFPGKSGSAKNLDRILRSLASFGLLEETVNEKSDGDVERLYSMQPGLGEFFAPNQNKGPNLSTIVKMATDDAIVVAMCNLHETVLNPGESAFAKVHGTSFYEWMEDAAGQHYGKVFHGSMTALSLTSMHDILNTYSGFKGLGSIVDVGGGVGACMEMLVKKYSSIQAISFDQPHVVELAPHLPGVKLVGGDMFESVPSADATFLKYILHNWDDEYCVKVLKNCYKALPDTGKLIIVESLLPPSSVDNVERAQEIISMDLAMLANQAGGRERSEKEFRSLVLAAGFSRLHVAAELHAGVDSALMEVFK